MSNAAVSPEPSGPSLARKLAGKVSLLATIGAAGCFILVRLPFVNQTFRTKAVTLIPTLLALAAFCCGLWIWKHNDTKSASPLLILAAFALFFLGAILGLFAAYVIVMETAYR